MHSNCTQTAAQVQSGQPCLMGYDHGAHPLQLAGPAPGSLPFTGADLGIVFLLCAGGVLLGGVLRRFGRQGS